MRKWAADLGIPPDAIVMLGDADASFTEQLGAHATVAAG
jgi:peroxiredoxin